IYAPLLLKVKAELCLQNAPENVSDLFPTVTDSSIQEKLKSKQIILENAKISKKKVKKPKRMGLTAVEKRRLKAFEIPKNYQKYECFTKLNELWNGYITEVLQDESGDSMLVALIKSDLHGAKIKVQRSKNKSVINKSGIIVKETANTFQIITEDDKLQSIPKMNSVFLLTTPIGKNFLLFGNSFCIKSAERITKKFKQKPMIDFFDSK
ncbi:RNase P subunit p29-like protein, partial [Rozella allomycis CSF55]